MLAAKSKDRGHNFLNYDRQIFLLFFSAKALAIIEFRQVFNDTSKTVVFKNNKHYFEV